MTRNRRTRIWPLHVATAIAVAAGLCGSPACEAAPALERPAPPLVVMTLDGARFDLSAKHGQVVIVNFWATWCPPCRDEMPLLDTYLAKHRAQGLTVIGLSVDRRRDRNDVIAVMKTFTYSAGLVDGAKANGFGPPQALPITYVVDRAGMLRAALLPGKGALTEAALDEVVLPLLASQGSGADQSRDQRPPDPDP